jgi:hypothetical protein
MSTKYLISDKNLIKSLQKHFKGFGFDNHLNTYFKGWFNYLAKLKEFRKDDFSLFEYVTISKNKSKDNNKNHNSFEPSELWKYILQGAISILKKLDLRENPSCHNKDILKKDSDKNDLPDIADLAHYYEKTIDFEKILYGSDPWYRDHFAHVIRVWLLGVYVVYELGNEIVGPSFASYNDTKNELFSKEELFAAYTISALTHDLGYPLEKLKKLNKKISEILDSFGGINWNEINASLSFSRHESALILLKQLSSKASFHKPDFDGPLRDEEAWLQINDFLEKRAKFRNLAHYQKFNVDKTSSYRIFLRCQWKYYEKYFDSLEGMKHGFLSALLLQRKLIFFKEGEFAVEEDYPFSIEESRQFLIRREILRAIATHTCDGIYIIKTLFLDSLLFFTDEIQEWGRPFFSDLYGGGIKNIKQKVYLSHYSQTGINWKVDAGEVSNNQAAFWLMTVSRKYSVRFRSAPEEDVRKFKCIWTLTWRNNNINYRGKFEFGGNVYKIELFKNGIPIKINLKNYNKKIDSGKLNIDDVVQNIIGLL